jgi:hypothetical protein
MSEVRFWMSVNRAASDEARLSDLPGYYDGPADAYRHIVGVAELHRRHGYDIAFAIAHGNEILGLADRWRRRDLTERDFHLREMDDHNNAIGLEIGATARTYEEVVRRARAAIDSAVAHRGSGADGTPRWRPMDEWEERDGRPKAERTIPVTWPSEIPSLATYRFGGERYNHDPGKRPGTPRHREAALLERLADTPTSEWSEEDVRGVIRSTPYQNRAAPGHERWQSRVRAYFEERDQRGAGTDGDDRDDTCGGVAAVRAHTRRGPSGPVQVSGHSRTVTCD